MTASLMTSLGHVWIACAFLIVGIAALDEIRRRRPAFHAEVHKFTLVDDGTMDTVVQCVQCGAEMRYNMPDDWITSDHNMSNIAERAAEWWEMCISMARDDHEDCPQEVN